MRMKSKIVIAGGGTGGHTYVAIAIADGLVDLGFKKNEILFFGSKRTIENELVPKSGYELVTFPGHGLNRREILKNIVHSIGLLFALVKALAIFIARRPQLVVGVGGYASVPAITAASILRINRVVHEQNSVLGRTNTLAQKLGAKVITTFPETLGANKTSVNLGLPLNKKIVDAITTREKIDFKNNPKKQVIITGGSLGSVALNEVVVSMISKYSDNIKYKIIHISGKKNYKQTKDLYIKENILDYVELFAYRDDLLDIYALADCVVARSGAGTCAELDALGIGCVLIPLESAPGNHQYLNAKYLQNKELATLIVQQDLNEDILFDSINNMLDLADKHTPNVFNLDSKSRIATYLNDHYKLLNTKTGK